VQRTSGDEGELVRALRRGDKAALAAFCAIYLDPVYGFIYYRVASDRQSAEDIAQETFLAAFEALERYDGRATLTTWLCGIARHKVGDHYRRRQRLEQARLALERLPDLAAEPTERLEREELRERVLATLHNLPPHYQQVLTLKYLDRLSGRQLADHLGLSEDAAESLLARARGAFRRAFRQQDSDVRKEQHYGPA
jgi:RNA polymerase sigma-70 factor (ECF subfamily)